MTTHQIKNQPSKNKIRVKASNKIKTHNVKSGMLSHYHSFIELQNGKLTLVVVHLKRYMIYKFGASYLRDVSHVNVH